MMKHNPFFLGSEQGMCKGGDRPFTRTHEQMVREAACQHCIQELKQARQGDL